MSQNTLARLSRSAIGQHLLESPLCADHFFTNQFEILERAHNMLQLHVLEASHIHFRQTRSMQAKRTCIQAEAVTMSCFPAHQLLSNSI